MPKRNITIDNVCPLIQYSAGHWADGSEQDPLANELVFTCVFTALVEVTYLRRYSDGGTFAVTERDAATLSFKFIGTGIW
jgi:hypothetical protein